MNKKLYSILLLLVGALMLVTFTACGSDDDDKNEPQLKTVTKTDLTSPWMILPISQVNDNSFSFLAFEDKRAAIGTMNDDSSVSGVVITDSWSISNGVVKVNGRELGKATKGTQNGVTVIFIDDEIYLPSNVKVNGESIEDSFLAGGVSREDFWHFLELANGK